MHITPQPSNELVDGEAEMATIHPDLQIEGIVRVVKGRGIAVRGTVHGPIECDGTVVVHHGATVHGTVQADRVVVAGEVKAGPQGEIVARSLLQLKPTGFVQAQRVRYGALEAERGGRLAGELCPVEAPAQRQVDAPRTQAHVGVPSARAPSSATPSAAQSAPAPAPAPVATAPAAPTPVSTPSAPAQPTAASAAPAPTVAAVMPLRSAAVIDLAPPPALQDHHEIADDSGPDMAAPAEMYFQHR